MTEVTQQDIAQSLMDGWSGLAQNIKNIHAPKVEERSRSRSIHVFEENFSEASDTISSLSREILHHVDSVNVKSQANTGGSDVRTRSFESFQDIAMSGAAIITSGAAIIATVTSILKQVNKTVSDVKGIKDEGKKTFDTIKTVTRFFKERFKGKSAEDKQLKELEKKIAEIEARQKKQEQIAALQAKLDALLKAQDNSTTKTRSFSFDRQEESAPASEEMDVETAALLGKMGRERRGEDDPSHEASVTASSSQPQNLDQLSQEAHVVLGLNQGDVFVPITAAELQQMLEQKHQEETVLSAQDLLVVSSSIETRLAANAEARNDKKLKHN